MRERHRLRSRGAEPDAAKAAHEVVIEDVHMKHRGSARARGRTTRIHAALWLCIVLAGLAGATAQAQTSPTAPTNVSVEAGDQELTVTWEAPTSDGGSAITRYQYRYGAGTTELEGATWAAVADTDADGETSDERSVRIRYLTNGTAYTVEVRAGNAAGDGAAARTEAATPRGPASKPGAPDLVKVWPYEAMIYLEWGHADARGSALTRYEYRYATTDPIPPGTRWQTLPRWATSTFVRGLTNGARHYIELRAANAHGEGASVYGQATPKGNPSAPRNVRVERAGPGKLRLSWDAPADNQGSTISGYAYRYRKGTSINASRLGPLMEDHVEGGDARSVIVSGLRNRRTSYALQVRATTRDGPWIGPAGAWSETVLGVTNIPPIATPRRVVVGKNRWHAFTPEDFGFFDYEGDALANILIINMRYDVPRHGDRRLYGTWVLEEKQIDNENPRAGLGIPKRISPERLNAGKLRYKPQRDDTGRGKTWIDYQVNDGLDDSPIYRLHIDVDERDEAPYTALTLPDQQVTVPADDNDETTTESAEIDFSVAQNAFKGRGTLTYAATTGAGNALPSWIAFDAQSLRFTGTAQAGQVGTLKVKVTATDTQARSASQIFNVTVVQGPTSTPVASISVSSWMHEGRPITSWVYEGDEIRYMARLSAPAPDGGLTVGYKVSHAHTLADYPNVEEDELGEDTLNFPAGSTELPFSIPTMASTAVNAHTQVRVRLLAGEGYRRQSHADVSTDVRNTTRATMEWDVETCETTISEKDEAITLTLKSDKASEQGMEGSSLTINTVNTSREDDLVESAVGRVVGIPAGEKTGEVRIGIVNDERIEGDEYFEAQLQRNALPEWVDFGTCTNVRVNITDDDTAAITVTGNDAVEGQDIVLDVGPGGTSLDCPIPVAYTVKVKPTEGTGVLTSSDEKEVTLGVCQDTAQVRFPTRSTAGDNGNQEVTFEVTEVQYTPVDRMPAGRLTLGAPTTITVRDATAAAVNVTPPASLTTSEAGGTAVFRFVLNGQPTHAVTVTAETSAPEEGRVSGPITFSTTNWATAQNITVTGANDDDADGPKAYEVRFTVTSDDPKYDGFRIASANLVNNDDEGAPVVTIANAPNATEGTPLRFPLTVTTGTAREREITVHWEASAPGTAGKARESDLQSIRGHVRLARGASAGTIEVGTVNDDIWEDDDEVSVTLTGVEDAVIGAQKSATGVIESEDPPPVITWRADPPIIRETDNPATPEKENETTIWVELDDRRRAECKCPPCRTAGQDGIW